MYVNKICVTICSFVVILNMLINDLAKIVNHLECLFLVFDFDKYFPFQIDYCFFAQKQKVEMDCLLIGLIFHGKQNINFNWIQQ